MKTYEPSQVAIHLFPFVPIHCLRTYLDFLEMCGFFLLVSKEKSSGSNSLYLKQALFDRSTLHRFSMTIPEHSLSVNGNSIEQLIDHMLAARRISRQDQDVFMSVLLAKRDLTDRERSQVNRIYDALRTGRLRVVE